MKTTISNLLKNIKKLFKAKNYDGIVKELTDSILEKIPKDEKDKVAELYLLRGNSWYEKGDYDSAIADYNKAIEIKNDYALAFYCRATTRGPKKRDYKGALEDYNAYIEISNPDRYDVYVDRGTAFRQLKEYENAIRDYSKAISLNSNCEEAYYNRGLTRKLSNTDIIEAKVDFERYLELTTSDNDVWSQYAKDYIREIEEQSSDDLFFITDIIEEIKKLLRVDEDLITHYTSLSALANLILENSKFRITEGNFLNDPSEGSFFYKFLEYKANIPFQKSFCSGNFAPKPFIGSFVDNEKDDDLSMWRSYGKEGDAEAKGCAITLWAQKFIDAINDSLSKENDYIRYESDINFYRVAYLNDKTGDIYISDINKCEKLKELMIELKRNVTDYKIGNKITLEKKLNSIAFLFKNSNFREENEVRMIVKGVGFTKKYMTNIIPPRVYIELDSIKTLVKQITFGPKVDSLEGWTYAFHYGCEDNPPEIKISDIPYR